MDIQLAGIIMIMCDINNIASNPSHGNIEGGPACKDTTVGEDHHQSGFQDFNNAVHQDMKQTLRRAQHAPVGGV
jgi:hypothetical protein